MSCCVQEWWGLGVGLGQDPPPKTLPRTSPVTFLVLPQSALDAKAQAIVVAMSQPGLPVTIDAAASSTGGDDASVLTGATGLATTTADAFETEWLCPNAEKAKLFELSKKSNAKSNVWLFFHCVKHLKPGVDINNDGVPSNYNPKNSFVCCNQCGGFLNVGKGKSSVASSSTLRKHLEHGVHKGVGMEKLVNQWRSHCTKIRNLDLDSVSATSSKRAKTQQSLGSFFQRPAVPNTLKMEHQQLSVVRFVVEQMLPFSVVESESFRNMMAAHNPHTRIMSNKRAKQLINLLSSHTRGTLTNEMKQETVNFTTDHWTSHANQNCAALTAHWIDSTWTLNSVSLGIFLHEGRTTAEELLSAFVDIWSDLDLTAVEILSVTTDTAANMNKVGTFMEEKGIAHVCCTDHNLQLTCKLLCSDETFDGQGWESIKKARNVVSFINKSTQANEKLKQKQAAQDNFDGRPKTVVTDVVTRWWSTHAMIERLLQLRPAIDMMAREGHLKDTPRLTDADWNNLEHILLILTPFKNAQKMLEGNHCVTAGWVLQHISHIRNQLTALTGGRHNRTVKRLAGDLLEDFNRRWKSVDDDVFTPQVQRVEENRQFGIHPLLLVATFLDPRFKELNAIPNFNNRRKVKSHVKKLMIELETKRRPTPPSPSSSSDEGVESVGHSTNELAEAMQAMVGQGNAAEEAVERPIRSVVEEELKAHEKEPQQRLAAADGDWNDPLDWWKEKQGKFPIMAALARMCLVVQASSAPSERVFSVASRVLSKFRTRMNPQVAGQLVFLSENWRDKEGKCLENNLEVLQKVANIRLGQPKVG